MAATPSNNSTQIVDGLPTLWFPQDHGYISWTQDPVTASGTYTLATAGTAYAVSVKVPSTTVTNIVYDITTGGGTLTSAQCFVALYQNGVLLGKSAEQHTAWTSTGVATTALATPVRVSQGIVQVVFYFNGTTGPTLAGGTAAVTNKAGLAAATFRYATADTSLTTAPPATLGTLTALAASPWVALS